MEPLSEKLEFVNEAEFDAAWRGTPTVAWFAPLGLVHKEHESETFNSACSFIGGAMLEDDFRLFRNGGSPLLERRCGGLVEEVVFLPGPKTLRGRYVPLTINVHLSHAGLRAVRSRYWGANSGIPAILSSQNAGFLQAEPRLVIWNVAAGERVLENLARWVRGLVLPWFDQFESPDVASRKFYDGDCPLPPDAALEWFLCEYGEGAADAYFHEFVLAEPALAMMVRQHLRSIDRHGLSLRPGESVAERIANIVFAYDLHRTNTNRRHHPQTN